MAYIPSECTKEQYENIVYSPDAKNKCYLSFNGVEYSDVDETLERITIKSNIINTSSQVFSLNNLISKSIEIRIHNLDLSLIQNPIELKIGTYINETIGYVYVPIGKFILQEKPTTSNGITTIKARDNSVLFDHPYNAKPLIDNSTETIIDENGNEIKVVTKKELLEDICNSSNVENGVTSFRGMDETLSIYDNSISARTYISYLAEQSGCFAYIDRNGKLQFIKLNELTTQTIPFDKVSSFTNSSKYKIDRVVYESGTIFFEYPTTAITDDILYLDGANPYITNETIVQEINDVVNGFTIDSLKIDKMYGNPCIDSFDYIQITDDNNIIYKTLGQNTLIYNGKLLQSFDTTISKEKRNTNTTLNSENYFKKYVKQKIDNETASLKIEVGEYTQKVDNLENETSNLNSGLDNLKGRTTNLEVGLDGVKIDVSDNTEKLSNMQYNFGTQALRIASSTSEVNSALDNTGIKVYNYDELTAVFNDKGSGVDKLIVTGTAQIGYLRFVKGLKGGKKVTQVFHLENLIEDLQDLVGDEQ